MQILFNTTIVCSYTNVDISVLTEGVLLGIGQNVMDKNYQFSNYRYLNPISVSIFNGKIYSLCQNNSISKKNYFKILF